MEKIIHEYESLANVILEEKEGIYIILSTSYLKGLKHYYFICSNKDKTIVKHIFLEKNTAIDKKIKKKNMEILSLSNSNRRLISLMNFCFNYEMKESSIDTKGNKFYCYLPKNNSIYGFGETCDNEIENGFYDFINYLLIHSKIFDKFFFRKEVEDDNIFQLSVMLDDEMTYNMESSLENRKLPFFKGFYYEIMRKKYSEVCDDLCSMMTNYELVMTTALTDYVYLVGNTLERLKPEVLNWDEIKKNKKAKFDNIINLISNKDYIYGLNMSDEEKEKAISKLDIDHQIELIMKLMKNDEILELSRKTNNWNAKLNIMKYIHSDK